MSKADDVLGRQIVDILRARGIDPQEFFGILTKETPEIISSQSIATEIQWSGLGGSFPKSIWGIKTLGELAILSATELRTQGHYIGTKRIETLRLLLEQHGLRFRKDDVPFEARARELFGSSDATPLPPLLFATSSISWNNYANEGWETVGDLRRASEAKLRAHVSLCVAIKRMKEYGVTGLPL